MDLSARIREFERRYGRTADSVKLLAVSKKHPAEKIRQAYAAGISNFGENYLQEALDKMESLDDLDLCWHFIGPIQSNKTRGIAEHFDWVHSVDREKIARRLNEQRQEAGTQLNVCVQVNLSSESSKSGTDFDGLSALCASIAGLANLKLRGLMAIPAALTEFDAQRQCFHRLALEFTRLAQQFPSMDTLSMGMSNDYEAAIAEGSTLIRIGTGIFGMREAVKEDQNQLSCGLENTIE